jgi:hypothetical protein
MMRIVLVVSMASVLAGCGGQPRPAPAPAPASGPLAAMCERHYQRERDCSDEYLAALVALRVEVDTPPGIAAEDARDGRDALIAKARVEWEHDSQPAERTRICAPLDAQVPGRPRREPDRRGRGVPGKDRLRRGSPPARSRTSARSSCRAPPPH